MRDPQFLSVDEVVFLHREGIRQYGGTDGLRDRGLLASTVFAPQQTFGGQYLYASLAAVAAAYWIGLVQNHPFVDGNKRVGVRAADVFLAVNGYDLGFPPAHVVDLTLQIATRGIARAQVVAQILQHLTPFAASR